MPFKTAATGSSLAGTPAEPFTRAADESLSPPRDVPICIALLYNMYTCMYISYFIHGRGVYYSIVQRARTRNGRAFAFISAISRSRQARDPFHTQDRVLRKKNKIYTPTHTHTHSNA